MLSGRTQSQTIRPADPPAALISQGQLLTEHLRWFVGGGLVLCVVGALLGLSGMALLPSYPEDAPLQNMAALAVLGLGLLVAGVGLYVLTLPLARERSHQHRLNEWHAVTLAAHENGYGLIVEQDMTEWSLKLDSAGAMLAAIVALHRHAERTGQAPSVRTLERGIWLDSPRGRQRRLFDVSNYQARELCAWLSETGLLDGRAPGQGGAWAPQSLDEAVTLFERGWAQ